MKTRVLILNEISTNATQYEHILSRAEMIGYSISDANLLEDSVQSFKPHVLLFDLQQSESDAAGLLEQVHSMGLNLPVILMANHPNIEDAVAAMKHHAADYLGKPFHVEDLLQKIADAGRRGGGAGESADGAMPAAVRQKIIGSSSSLNNLLDMVQKVARTDINVMVTGDSGTGKEVIARAIHQLSNRRNEAFVPVDCASFPENLLESELFGYKKGAFTGAHKDQKGLLEFANKGTLFLDEIGEMPILLQAKLLRVLQERQFRPIGGLEQKAMDVRVLAATNRNLVDMVQNKTFRQDLFFRLNVMTLSIPPLRERSEDIALLARHFLRIFVKDNRLQIRDLTPAALGAMRQYDWPGNVRELQNVVESAATICMGDMVDLADLPEQIRGRGVEVRLNASKHRNESVDEFQREYLINLLVEHEFNISRAAEKAGCHRRTLHRMINRYDLNVNQMREQYDG